RARAQRDCRPMFTDSTPSTLYTSLRDASPFRGNDGPPPGTPQREERIDPTLSEGQPGVGRDGKGRGRGHDLPAPPGGPLRRRDRRAPPRRIRRPERPARDRPKPARDPPVEGGEVRDPRGSRRTDQTGREPPDASQRAWGGLEQQEGPAADRGEDSPPFAVLQGTRGPARGLGLLVESFGTPSEVGGRCRSASRTWPRPGSSNELERPQPSWTASRGSACS